MVWDVYKMFVLRKLLVDLLKYCGMCSPKGNIKCTLGWLLTQHTVLRSIKKYRIWNHFYRRISGRLGSDQNGRNLI